MIKGNRHDSNNIQITFYLQFLFLVLNIGILTTNNV
jgi:hypothetical protein